jgi:hypothetical protein
MQFKLPKKERLSPNHTRKLSDAVLEFAQMMAPVDGDPAVFRMAVELAVTIWNVGALPGDQHLEGLLKVRTQLNTMSNPVMDAQLHEWFDVRRTKFANDRRFIMDYVYEHNAKGPYLQVASVDLALHERSGASGVSGEEPPTGDAAGKPR